MRKYSQEEACRQDWAKSHIPWELLKQQLHWGKKKKKIPTDFSVLNILSASKEVGKVDSGIALPGKLIPREFLTLLHKHLESRVVFLLPLSLKKKKKRKKRSSESLVCKTRAGWIWASPHPT